MTVQVDAGLRSRRASTPPRGSGAAFRPDVEGIRALAVVLVMLYHARVPFVPGGYVGVDVFFVVSGFLITGLLLRELAATGRIDVASFYARRAKRLLPAGTLVLAATCLATWLLLPSSRWTSVVTDVRAAALFVVNWVFAGRATDYLAAQDPPSPVQHYWSLSVEEQFYFVWPALLVTFAWVARRRALALRPMLLAAMGVVLVPSLLVSVLATRSDPSMAYFSTFTRLWEMALGGLVALLATGLARLPWGVRGASGLVGLGLVVGAAVTMDEGTPFPGTAALVPTLGAALLVVAGLGGHTGAVTRGLSARPAVVVGGLSYSLYLWHWPPLAILAALHPDTAWPVLVVVCLASVGPAWLAHRYVENPIRHARVLSRRPRPALVMGVALIAVSLVCAAALQRAAQASGGGDSAGSAPGAGRMLDRAWVEAHPDPQRSAEALVPTPAGATQDRAQAYDDGCMLNTRPSAIPECVYGDLNGRLEVALAGDSHAASLLPALVSVAAERGWRVRTYLRANCPLTDSSVTIDRGDGAAAPYTVCQDWKDGVRARLAADPPDLLLLTGSNTTRFLDGAGRELGAEGRAEVQRGFREIAVEAERNGTVPVFVADVPRMVRDGRVMNAPDCVARHLDDLGACAAPRDEALGGNAALASVLADDPGYDWRQVDLTDALCLPDLCPAVIGDVLVYFDFGHLTRTFSESLAPWLERGLRDWTSA